MPGLVPCRGLPARLVEDPSAQLDDEARLLCRRNETIGTEQSELRMLPAHQRFQTEDLAGIHFDQRLVVEDEFLVHQSPAQPVLHFERFERLVVHGRGVELERIAPGVLRSIHGRVRIADQRLSVGPIDRVHRDADAAGDHELAIVDGDRGAQGLQHFLGDLSSVLNFADDVDQDGELITAESRHGVFLPHGGAEARCDGPKKLVADGMAKRVVDLLETVDVEEQDRELVAMPHRMREGYAQPVIEQGAIGQSGDRVVIGQSLHF